jgi:hypothetical protein
MICKIEAGGSAVVTSSVEQLILPFVIRDARTGGRRLIDD